MKKVGLVMAAILATSSALVPVSATAALFNYGAETMVKKSQKGGLIVRNVWSDKPLGTCGTTMCDKPEDIYAAWCLGPGYKNASDVEKKRIQAALSRELDFVVVMDVGLFLTDRGGAFARKGTVQTGDAVELSAAPLKQLLSGYHCTNPKTTALFVERVLKHHDGTILYSNGKVFGGSPSNEKPATKPTPKPPSFLD